MSKTVNSKIQMRRDTSTNWSTNNPTLAAGEIGFDTTVKKFKIGDGSTVWNNLEYFIRASDVTTLIQSALAEYGDGDVNSFGGGGNG